MIKITIQDSISEKYSGLVIGKSYEDFENEALKNEEKEYIQGKLGKKDKIISLNQYNRWLFFMVVDESKKVDDILEEIRKNAAKIHSTIVDNDINKILLSTPLNNHLYLYAAAEGLALKNYQFNKYLKDKDKKLYPLDEINIVNDKFAEKELEELKAQVQAVYHARTLVNEPLSYLTAEKLGEEIQEMGKEAGFKVEVLHETRIESLKMGGLLAVNKGSVDPPTFSILEWKPEGALNKKPVVLVGKGVVYDTGGLSLKPTSNSMDYMKSDMAGAAAVAGILYAVAMAALPIHVIGLVPATDNRPDGNAYAPGDIITMHDGSTVEVMNTDAEGRLLLADALSYAKQYDPGLVIDLATLTGSAAVAIGHHGIVGMGNAGNAMFDALKKAGDRVFERVVEFPFWDDYKELLKSDIADLKNLGGKYAGAITAGKFLEHFTDYPFIHLDIAGPAYLHKPESYLGKGGTGTGIRVIFNFLKDYGNAEK